MSTLGIDAIDSFGSEFTSDEDVLVGSGFFSVDAEDVYIQDGQLYLSSKGAGTWSQPHRLLVFKDSGIGAPTATLLAISDEVVITDATPLGWIEFPFPNHELLSGGVWIALWSGPLTGSNGPKFLMTGLGTMPTIADQYFQNGVTYHSVAAPSSVTWPNTSPTVSWTHYLNMVAAEAPVLLDDFNRVDAVDLGSNYTQVASISSGHLSLVSNEAKTSGGPVADAWTADIFGDSQEVEIVLRAADHNIWLLLAMPDPTDPDFTGYLLDIQITGGVVDLDLYRGVSGSFSVLAGDGAYTFAVDDVWRFRKNGGELSVFINDVLLSAQYPIFDPAPLSDGYIGIGSNNSTNNRLDNLKGGNLVSPDFGGAGPPGIATILGIAIANVATVETTDIADVAAWLDVS